MWVTFALKCYKFEDCIYPGTQLERWKNILFLFCINMEMNQFTTEKSPINHIFPLKFLNLL